MQHIFFQSSAYVTTPSAVLAREQHTGTAPGGSAQTITLLHEDERGSHQSLSHSPCLGRHVLGRLSKSISRIQSSAQFVCVGCGLGGRRVKAHEKSTSATRVHELSDAHSSAKSSEQPGATTAAKSQYKAKVIGARLLVGTGQGMSYSATGESSPLLMD